MINMNKIVFLSFANALVGVSHSIAFQLIVGVDNWLLANYIILKIIHLIIAF